MTASSTQDIGIAFSKKQKTFIHVIDEHIDNERSKIVNDLVFTGCVQSLDMVDRPWVPRDAYNSTGDRLRTDGAAAVLRLNSCDHPRSTAETVAKPPERFQRATRDTTLTIKNGLYRGNLIYQGISGGIKVHDYFRSSSELPENYGAWRKTDASGAQYKGLAGSPDLKRRQSGGFSEEPNAADLAAMEKARESHKWDPPRYEFALQGGYMHMRENDLTTVAVFYESSVPTKPYYELYLTDVVDDGWAGGGTVTLNSWKYFSSEFGYFREQIKYELDQYNYTAVLNSAGTGYDEDESLDADRIGLVTRQFEYNLLAQARPPRSRWRPYAAVGPVFQLIALNGAPLKKPAGPFTLGLKNIGLIKAAFDFGNTPPLDGGGIFQFGLEYGAGVKYRVSPRVMVRADWRETWSKNPDIISSSYSEYNPPDLDSTYTTTVTRLRPDRKFLQDRFTLGVAFTF
jgi:opacity protein-like surface antigen